MTVIIDEYIREMNLGFDAAIAFNSCGQHETTMEGQNIYEYMHVPFYNWILDHPCEHSENIISDLRNYHIICIDRDHVNFIRRYYPSIAGVSFIPLGAFCQNYERSYEAFRKREYNVIFTGSLLSLDELGVEISELPLKYRKISTDIIERMIDDRNCTNETALRYALQNYGIDAGRDEMRKYAFITRKTNPFVRAYIREEVIRYLAQNGLEIDVFGSGWEVLKNRGGLTLHGAITYEQSVELCKAARICFNVMPLFKDGLHDRIPTAMLGGAVVMTDSSGFVDEYFVTEGINKELLKYDINHPELVAEQISDVLLDSEELYSISQRGFQKAQQGLTWDDRVDELIELMER